MIQIPDHRKIRIILCCDAKNEADHRYAIVHALLTRRFCVRGMAAAVARHPAISRRLTTDNRMILEDMFCKIKLYYLSAQ